MRPTAILKYLLFPIGAALLLSCGGDDEGGSRTGRTLDVVYRGQQCPPVEGDMAMLRSREALDAFVDRASGSGMAPNIPPLDFPRQMALVIAAGQKPTAGYRVGLEAGEAPVNDRQLQVPVTVKEPGEVAAQVLTSPCLVLGIDSRGLDSIKRLDTGAVLRL